VAAGSPRAVDVILAGGFAAGLLDIANAIAFWWLYAGTPPQAILQSVAAGLLGKPAFAGGAATAALGLCLHFAIMFAMAAVYWLACRRWPWMIAKPVHAGIAYGLLTWAVMNHVVVPLSRAQPPPFIPAWFADGLLAHVLLVGLVFAFVARRSAGGVSLSAVRSGTRRGT
jgi:uncharacterized membrane protein YagU involved in acid resistance